MSCPSYMFHKEIVHLLKKCTKCLFDPSSVKVDNHCFPPKSEDFSGVQHWLETPVLKANKNILLVNKWIKIVDNATELLTDAPAHLSLSSHAEQTASKGQFFLHTLNWQPALFFCCHSLYDFICFDRIHNVLTETAPPVSVQIRLKRGTPALLYAFIRNEWNIVQ